MVPADKYWFPAKRYGWGWGLPRRWEGWVVLAAFIALLTTGAGWILPRMGWWIAYVLGLSAAFCAIAWWKGEPPRWRWGD